MRHVTRALWLLLALGYLVIALACAATVFVTVPLPYEISGTPTAMPLLSYSALLPYAANIPRATATRIDLRTPTPRATATRFTGTRPPTWTPAQTQTPYPAQGDRARVMAVSVYVPMAGGINGGACVARPWAACFVQTGGAACGAFYPRGTVFTLPDWAGVRGMPLVVRCVDRGAAIGAGNLDIALVSGDVRGDLSKARAWGRRLVRVGIVAPGK